MSKLYLKLKSTAVYEPLLAKADLVFLIPLPRIRLQLVNLAPWLLSIRAAE